MKFTGWKLTTNGIYSQSSDIHPKLDHNSVVAVHDGLFHADELLSLAILEAASGEANFKVIRTRKPEELVNADLWVDVGGIYDPTAGNFDHHQWRSISNAPHFVESWDSEVLYEDTSVVSPMAACALLWHAFGMSATLNLVIQARFNVVPTEQQLFNIWRIVLQKLIYPVSSHDVGVISAPFESDREISLSQCVRSYNARDFNKFPREQQRGFEAAREFLWWQLKGAVEKAASQVFNIETLHKAVAKTAGSCILILEEAIPWKELVLQDPERYRQFLVCVLPGNGTSWNVLSFPGDEGFMSNRCPAPEHLRALSSQEAITTASNGAITQCTFVHASGFLGACLSREGAIELAKYWVTYSK